MRLSISVTGVGLDFGVRVLALHHVGLIVADTARALAFYQGVLGLTVEAQRPDLGYPGAWLRLPSGQQLHLFELPNPDPVAGRPAHGGRDRHVALWVTDLKSLAAALRCAQIAFTRSRSGRQALFCRDPDGNALEFIQWPPDGFIAGQPSIGGADADNTAPG